MILLPYLNIQSQRKINGSQNTFNVVHDITIPEANHLIAFGFQIRGAFRIIFLLIKMLGP
jgi:hypothetical protein